MSNSLLAAFRQLRVGGVTVGTNGDRLTVGSTSTVMVNETGQFASAAGLSALDARLISSGAALQAQIAAVSAGGGGVQLTGDQTVVGIKNFTTDLQRSGSSVVTAAQTGQFASAAGLSTTNTNLSTTNSNVSSLTVAYNTTSGNLVGLTTAYNTTSGNLASLTAAYNTTSGRLEALSGTLVADYVARASQVNVVTIIPTGVDDYFIAFGVTFGQIPKVQCTVEVTGDITYFCAVRGRTTSGYTALFSDTVRESGVSVNTFASIA